MKQNKKILITSIALFWVILAHGQNSANASGGKASGSGGVLSYSVGQIVWQTHTGTNGSIAEGVNTSYTISEVTNLEEAKGITLSVSAYPNPTTDYLTLNINEFEISNLTYRLYNLHGKLLQSEKITGNQTTIVMSQLLPASYLVKVIQRNKEVKTFKIIKR